MTAPEWVRTFRLKHICRPDLVAPDLCTVHKASGLELLAIARRFFDEIKVAGRNPARQVGLACDFINCGLGMFSQRHDDFIGELTDFNPLVDQWLI